jgi:hypothetical protein
MSDVHKTEERCALVPIASGFASTEYGKDNARSGEKVLVALTT